MGGASEGFIAILEGFKGVDVIFKAVLSYSDCVLELLLSLSKGVFCESDFITGV